MHVLLSSDVEYIIIFIIYVFNTHYKNFLTNSVYSFLETAINIGYSCRLISDEMVDIFIVDGYEYSEVEDQLRKYREAIANVLSHSQGTTACNVVRFHNDFNAVETPVDPTGGFALVVNGHSLVSII